MAKYDRLLRVMLTDDIAARLREAADRELSSMSVYARAAIAQKLARDGFVSRDPPEPKHHRRPARAA